MSKLCRYSRPALAITCSRRGILSHLALTGNLTSYERLGGHNLSPGRRRGRNASETYPTGLGALRKSHGLSFSRRIAGPDLWR
jgi:hypothetical protein